MSKCECGCSMIDFLCYDCINECCPMRALAAEEAKAIEAQRAETTQIGSVADESAVPKGFAHNGSEPPHDHK